VVDTLAALSVLDRKNAMLSVLDRNKTGSHFLKTGTGAIVETSHFPSHRTLAIHAHGALFHSSAAVCSRTTFRNSPPPNRLPAICFFALPRWRGKRTMTKSQQPAARRRYVPATTGSTVQSVTKYRTVMYVVPYTIQYSKSHNLRSTPNVQHRNAVQYCTVLLVL